VAEPNTGVTRAWSPIRPRAASMSASVGAVLVAKVEHLAKDRTNRRERIELAPLHPLEQARKLPVAGDGGLEVPPRARGRDREDLGGEVAAAALLEPRFPPVRLDRLPQLVHPAPAERIREHERRPPLARGREREHLAHVGRGRTRERVVALVHRDHVRDLHDPGLERLHRVARARLQHEHDRVRDREHADVALPAPDRLEEDHVLAGRVEQEERLERRLGEPARVPARPHRADEDLRVEEVVGEADPVAEEGAAGERARRVDRDHADGGAARANAPDERRDEARLARARRAREADGVRAPGVRVERADDLVGGRVAVLDERDRTGERARVAAADALDERVRVDGAAHAWTGCGAARTLRAKSQASPVASAIAPAATAYDQRAPIAFVTGPAATKATPRTP